MSVARNERTAEWGSWLCHPILCYKKSETDTGIKERPRGTRGGGGEGAGASERVKERGEEEKGEGGRTEEGVLMLILLEYSGSDLRRTASPTHPASGLCAGQG